MKRLRKSMGYLVIALAFVMAFGFAVQTNAAEKAEMVTGDVVEMKEAQAGQQKASVQIANNNNFWLAYQNTTGGAAFSVVRPSDADYVQIGVFDVSGNLVAYSSPANSYASVYGLANNKVYICKIRTLNYNYSSGQYVATSGWSGGKAISTLVKYNLKQAGKKTAFSIKLPKMAGVKTYTIYMSKTYNGSFKKVGTVKPGKKKVINKFKGKGFKYYQTYYYKAIPTLKNGMKAQTFIGGSFYFRKVFR